MHLTKLQSIDPGRFTLEIHNTPRIPNIIRTYLDRQWLTERVNIDRLYYNKSRLTTIVTDGFLASVRAQARSNCRRQHQRRLVQRENIWGRVGDKGDREAKRRNGESERIGRERESDRQ